MRAVRPILGILGAFALSACSDEERSVRVDTGTAEATVTTEAPPAQAPDIQLQQQAQQAATAASTPVDGSGPVVGTTPQPPAKAR